MKKFLLTLLLLVSSSHLNAQDTRYIITTYENTDSLAVKNLGDSLKIPITRLNDISYLTSIPLSRPDLIYSLYISPLVWFVELDEFVPFPIQPFSPPSTDQTAEIRWNISMTRANELWNKGITGENIKVGIIDTGISCTHPALKVDSLLSRHFVNNGNPISGCENWGDVVSVCNAHGSHVAGTAAGRNDVGMAPEATLVALSVFQNVGGKCGAYPSQQIAALEYAKNNNIRVVNVSIGGNWSGGYELAVENYAKWGGFFIAAAGNDGSSSDISFPGKYSYGVAVGALTSSGSRASFSNRGEGLDISAPGNSIYSTLKSGYGTKSGTSMASPHVAGAVALLLSKYPHLKVWDFVELVAEVNGKNWNSSFGWGKLDVFALDSALTVNPSFQATPPSFPINLISIPSQQSGFKVDSIRVKTIFDGVRFEQFGTSPPGFTPILYRWKPELKYTIDFSLFKSGEIKFNVKR